MSHNRESIISKYRVILNDDYINQTYSEFEVIKSKLFLFESVGDVVDEYLEKVCHIESIKGKIKILKCEIIDTENKLFGIKNQSVDILRKDNHLLTSLDRLSSIDLNQLRHIVDIKSEFEKIDKHRFNQSKNNSGDLDKLLFSM